ncbi:uncharacterized protein LOC115889422 [Sitophilus oryzae]|uniref:Uncharacterized protein LOC115889422 n=1 Tax=Sitophilus oryzae TaxID=7048 RepID=A0A6J2YR59_SITOR|nr:uncharacterized protein LOC115889422 [Sitophilus oryzae]
MNRGKRIAALALQPKVVNIESESFEFYEDSSVQETSQSKEKNGLDYYHFPENVQDLSGTTYISPSNKSEAIYSALCRDKKLTKKFIDLPQCETDAELTECKLTEFQLESLPQVSLPNKIFNYLENVKKEYPVDEDIDLSHGPEESSGSEYILSNASSSTDSSVLTNSNTETPNLVKKSSTKNKLTVSKYCNNVNDTLVEIKYPEYKVLCIFCYTEVGHFTRHLMRQHLDEPDIQKIMAMPAKSAERRKAFAALRKKGRFFLAQQTNHINPIQLPRNICSQNKMEDMESNYFPCNYCLGFYSKSYLWKHKKMCNSNIDNIPTKSRYHLSESQTFLAATGLLGNYLNKSRLKKEVLNIMRPDAVSNTVKKDALICLYGESLLNKHKRIQINVHVSNKMREMAKLKISLEKMISFENLIFILKPQYYDKVLTSVKIISGYDAEKKIFKAPSLALHMGTNLQQLCNIAKKALITKNPLIGSFEVKKRKEICRDIEEFCDIIKNHWCNDISSIANKILNENKNIKPKIIPLTQDVKMFNEYVIKLAREAYHKLITNENLKKDR